MKIDMQISKEGNANWPYEYRFALPHENIDDAKTHRCATLYDLCRHIIASSCVNQIAQRTAVADLVKFYFGDDALIVDKNEVVFKDSAGK